MTVLTIVIMRKNSLPHFGRSRKPFGFPTREMLRISESSSGLAKVAKPAYGSKPRRLRPYSPYIPTYLHLELLLIKVRGRRPLAAARRQKSRCMHLSHEREAELL